MRIAKLFPSDRFTDGGEAHDYYHPACYFEVICLFIVLQRYSPRFFGFFVLFNSPNIIQMFLIRLHTRAGSKGDEGDYQKNRKFSRFGRLRRSGDSRSKNCFEFV